MSLEDDQHTGTISWLAGLIARLFVFAFVSPFLVLGGAGVFGATELLLNPTLAPVAMAVFVVGAMRAVLWWFGVCPTFRR